MTIWSENLVSKTKIVASKINNELQYRRSLLLARGALFKLNSQNNIVLKTDAWNEALGEDDYICKILPKNSFCYSVDISKPVIEAAKINYSTSDSVSFEVGDLTSLRFDSNTFDSIYSPSTLDHMPPQKVQQSLNELYRVLKPRGRAEITFDNALSFWLYALIFRLLLSYNSSRSWYPLTKWECIKMLRKSGFKILCSDAILLYPTVGGVMRLQRSILSSAVNTLLQISKSMENRSKFLNVFKAELVFIVEKADK